MAFNGLGMNMGNVCRLSAAKTRSISPENFTGEKGAGGMATEGTGAQHARDIGRGGRYPRRSPSAAGRLSRWPRSTGPALFSISG